MGLASRLASAQTRNLSSRLDSPPSPSTNTNIKMNTIKDIEALEPNLKETKDLLDAIYRKYKMFPDVEHSQKVAALVHLVGKELEMIMKERKSSVELNKTLREKIQEYDTKTNDLQIAIVEMEK
jgi:hypothetical protein